MPACYIIGHKNPDTDSICAALAYADFKHRIGEPNFVAARCGNTNARIDAILSRFGVAAPVFVGDVTPRLKDVMSTHIHKTRPSHTCSEALELLERYDVRVLPVVNVDNQLLGQVSVFGLGEFFVPHKGRARELRRVYTTLMAISHAIEGTVHHLVEPDRVEELFIRVGAVSAKRFEDISRDESIPMAESILVVGDRVDLQMVAINAGVRLIVMTMGTQPEPEVLAAAKAAGVSVMTSTYDSANTSWLIRTANRIEELFEKEVITFAEDETLTSIRRKVMPLRANVFFVTDEEGRLKGTFSKNDLYKQIPTNLILVDHNEVTQAVDGAAEVDILEILDHHRLGNLPTQKPIRFINEPVGSTCTIIADLFRKEGLVPSPAIAALMMAGIITDTLNLQSPTATLKDATLLTWLSTIANLPIGPFATDIFSQGSVLLTSQPREALLMDHKAFTEGGHRFLVSQIEEVGFEHFWERYEALLKELKELRAKDGAVFAGLLITDVVKQVSLLLADAPREVLEKIQYPQLKPHVFDIGGMVSRKKQVVPYLSEILRS